MQFAGWALPTAGLGVHLWILYVWVHFIWSVLLQFIWWQMKAILEHMAIDSVFKNTV